MCVQWTSEKEWVIASTYNINSCTYTTLIFHKHSIECLIGFLKWIACAKIINTKYLLVFIGTCFKCVDVKVLEMWIRVWIQENEHNVVIKIFTS